MRRHQTIEDLAIWTRLALRMPDMMLESASGMSDEMDSLQMVDDVHQARSCGRGVVNRLHEKFGVPGFPGKK